MVFEMIEMEKKFSERQKKAIKEINEEGEYVFYGVISEIITKNKLSKKEAKEVLDYLHIKNTKLRWLIYDQIELRKN